MIRFKDPVCGGLQQQKRQCIFIATTRDLPGILTGQQCQQLGHSSQRNIVMRSQRESSVRPLKAATVAQPQLANTTNATQPQLRSFGYATDFAARFQLGDYLGSGSFGTVHVGFDKQSGQQFAVKTMRKRFIGGFLEPHFVRRIQHEVDMATYLGRSLNIVQLHGVFEDDQCVELVMTLCTGGDLWSRIRRGVYSEREAARIVADVLRAVAQCHSRGVVVRDVKPENFLFLDDTPDAPLKMIDFGIAEYCGPDQLLEDRAGSPVYCAPEVLRKKYGLKADVWSVGVLAYELLAARLPFKDLDGDLLCSDLRLSRAGMSNKDIFASVLSGQLEFESAPWPSLSPAAKDLVQRLLTQDPAARPTAAEALEHPWLKEAHSSSKSRHSRPQGHAPAAAPAPAPAAPPAAEDAPGLMSDSLVQRLQRYGTYHRLQQVALSRIASVMHGYNSKQLEELQAALGTEQAAQGQHREQMGPCGASDQDVPCMKKIPYPRVVEVLRSGRFDLSEAEITQLLSSFHVSQDGCIDIDEWMAALYDWSSIQDSPEWDALVERVFDSLDVDGSGELGVEELESLLCDPDAGCPIADEVPSLLRDAEGAASALEPGLKIGKSQPGGPMVWQSEGQRASPSGSNGRINLTAFARLLRSARQDRLDLFESRRISRAGSMEPV